MLGVLEDVLDGVGYKGECLPSLKDYRVLWK